MDNGFCHSHFFGDDGKKSVSGQEDSWKTVVWFSDICVYVDDSGVVLNVQTTKRMGVADVDGGVFVVVFGGGYSEGAGKRERK